MDHKALKCLVSGFAANPLKLGPTACFLLSYPERKMKKKKTFSEISLNLMKNNKITTIFKSGTHEKVAGPAKVLPRLSGRSCS